MGIPVILTSAHVKLFINNKEYKIVQSVSLQISYNEEPIYGIDSTSAQEIATTRISVSGSINGLRVKNSGGLQAQEIRPLFVDLMSSPYISIRIQDRQSGEDIVFLPQSKVTSESHSISTKSSYKMNFNFISVLPLMALDRS